MTTQSESLPQNKSNKTKSILSIGNFIVALLVCILAFLGFYYANIKGKEKSVLNLNNEAFDLIGGNKGSVYINTGLVSDTEDSNRMELALRKIEEGLSIIPDNCRGLELKAIYYAEVGGEENIKTAQSLLSKVITFYPAYPLSYNNMGNILSNLGQFEDAVKYYKISINKYKNLKKTSPHSIENNKMFLPNNGLGNYYYQIGDYQNALKYFNNAKDLRPDYPPAWNNHGNALAELGKFEQSVESYKEAIRLNSNFSTAYYNLIKAQIETGDDDEAKTNFIKLLSLEIDPRMKGIKEMKKYFKIN